MACNKGLHKASRNKKDEFYTQISDIEKELKNYREQLKDKIIFCNCDDPEYSNFWKYFELNFEFLKIKKLIATHYQMEVPSYKLELVRTEDGIKKIKTTLIENGDFRSEECIEILKEADIVVTNPPFSLFREYVAQLIEYDKQFIIIGNVNAITYKEIFSLIKNNKIWLGQSIHSGDREFKVPNDYPLKASGYRVDEEGNKYIRVKGVRWYTNLDYKERHEDLLLYKNYIKEEYPKYYNFDAINVDKTKEIPIDYDGLMGVPITFMDKYNPNQFEIVGLGIAKLGLEIGVNPYTTEHKEYRKKIQKKGAVDGDVYLQDKNGQPLVPYARVIIKRKINVSNDLEKSNLDIKELDITEKEIENEDRIASNIN